MDSHLLYQSYLNLSSTQESLVPKLYHCISLKYRHDFQYSVHTFLIGCE